MAPRLPLAARLYGLCLRALPPSVRREDGAEMVQAFADVWTSTPNAWRRVVRGVRMVGRLPLVVSLEWLDVLEITGNGSTGGWEMTGWGKNVRYAVRTLRKAPSFTFTTIALIGLGVGAVTTIFTLVDHVLLRPLPYPAAERLITVENGSHSGLIYRELEALNGVEAWAAGSANTANLTGEGDPIRIEVADVTDGFFALFGARPGSGRLLVTDDFVSPEAVVISHAMWQSVFGADPTLVGRTIRIDGVAHTVVGVLTPDFEVPQGVLSAGVSVYRPMDWTREQLMNPGYHVLQVAGRLAPGVTMGDVQAQLDDVIHRLGREYPDQMLNRDGEVELLPVAGLQDSSVQRVRTGLNLLFGAVGLLLLVACLNVAHLFLARGLGRVQEMSVRRALGAGTGGLTQQLFTESVVLAVGGAAFGVFLAWLGLEAFMRMNPDAVPRSQVVGLDLRVVGFAAVVSLATAVLFGLVPALRTIGSDLANGLRGASRYSTDGRGARRVRAGLVVAEVALSLILVAQAGLLMKSFATVQARNPGFELEGVWTVPLTPTGLDTPEQYVEEMDQVLAALQAVPGVRSAGYGLTQPFEFTGGGRCCWSTRLEVDGVAHEGVRFALHPVSRGYLETLGVPMVAGTVWSESAADEMPVPGVITERLALDVFGSAEASMGRVIGAPGRLQVRVVGVAGDVKHYGLDQPDPTAAYLPLSALTFAIPLAHMAVRVQDPDQPGLARSLREAIWQVAPDLPIPTVRTMEDWVAASVSGRRFDSAVFGAFGLAGLLLAAAGLYGTLLYNVRQQRRELGIRLALGAARGRVEREVVVRGVRLAVLGVAIGLAGSVWAGGLLESRLFEVGATDPVALGAAALALLTAAVVSSWLPARRAGRTDPLQTLKAE